MSKVLQPEDLKIGNKYVPKSKSVGNPEYGKIPPQGFLYYVGIRYDKHCFSVNRDGMGNFFLPSDMEEYEEPAVPGQMKSKDVNDILPHHDEFLVWIKGITKGENTTVADLYGCWIENVYASLTSAPASESGKDWVKRYADLRETENMEDAINKLVAEVTQNILNCKL